MAMSDDYPLPRLEDPVLAAQSILAERREGDCCNRGECWYPTVVQLALAIADGAKVTAPLKADLLTHLDAAYMHAKMVPNYENQSERDTVTAIVLERIETVRQELFRYYGERNPPTA